MKTNSEPDARHTRALGVDAPLEHQTDARPAVSVRQMYSMRSNKTAKQAQTGIDLQCV